MKKILIILLVLSAVSEAATEVEPYETAKISKEQWDEYHSVVASELSSSRRVYKEHSLEIFSDDETRATIAFTMPGHDAHPAWVTRHVVFEDGELNLAVIGYFAGDEAAFSELFEQYERMAEQTRKKFKKK